MKEVRNLVPKSYGEVASSGCSCSQPSQQTGGLDSAIFMQSDRGLCKVRGANTGWEGTLVLGAERLSEAVTNSRADSGRSERWDHGGGHSSGIACHTGSQSLPETGPTFREGTSRRHTHLWPNPLEVIRTKQPKMFPAKSGHLGPTWQMGKKI